MPESRSTKDTLLEPDVRFSTEIWPQPESWSSSRSRRSIRSFGASPSTSDLEIVLLRLASSCAILDTSPPGPAIAVYWSLAPCWAATICDRTDWIESTRPLAFCTSACLAAVPSGDLERSDHAFQNFASCWLMPFSPGSASDISALSSWDALALHSLTLVFCARYCESRNWSRTRRKPWTSTPVPRWAPTELALPLTVSCSAVGAESSMSWREYRLVEAGAIVWPVVSSMRCWAKRPRREVCM